MFVHDPMAALLKTSIFLVGCRCLCLRAQLSYRAGCIAGRVSMCSACSRCWACMVMVSAHSLLTVYLGLELLSLSLYAMVAFDRDSAPASEAAMKYFVLGALASGMLLYGMSMLYGATGSLDITQIATAIGICRARVSILVFGLCFIVVGIGVQVRRRAVPYVGAGCLPWRTYAGDAVHRQRAQDRRLRHGDAPAGPNHSAGCRPTGRACWPSWPCCRWPSATWSPSRRPTSNACSPIRPSRTSVSCCWASCRELRQGIPPPCSTPSPMRSWRSADSASSSC